MEPITLKGIHNATDASLCENGESSMIVNLRYKNEQWEPIGDPTLVLSLGSSAYKQVFIHQNNAYVNLLAYDGEGLYWLASRQEERYRLLDERLKITSIPHLRDVETVGNTLVLMGEGAPMKYALHIDGKYRFLGTRPDYPDIHFRLESYEPKSVKIDYYQLKNITNVEEMFNWEKTAYGLYLLGRYYECMRILREKKLFRNPMMIRYVLRLYDGSHIMHSLPIPIFPRETIFPMKSVPVRGRSNYPAAGIYEFVEGSLALWGERLMYAVLGEQLDAWRDIVTHIDVYATSSIDPVLPTQDYVSITRKNSYPLADFEIGLQHYSRTEIGDKLFDSTNYFKIGSIDNTPDQISSGVQFRPVTIQGDLNQLVHQAPLPYDDNSMHQYQAQSSFVYNNRLHLGNITTYLTNGYPMGMFRFPWNFLHDEWMKVTPWWSIQDMYTEVLIDVSEGTRRLVRHVHSPLYFSTISPFIGYPDSRARRLTMTIVDVNGAVFQKSFSLIPGVEGNYAYYRDPEMKNIVLDAYGEIFVPPVGDDVVEYAPNMMRVSAPNNPFVFPLEQTYHFSNAEVITMAAATSAMSQGQFGRFPLYVFTREGIWTLEVGSGLIVYATQHLLRLDVVLSAAGVFAIDDSVVFATDKGLMVLKGSDVVSLSEPIDQRFDVLPACYAQNSSSAFNSALTDVTPFKEYLKESKVCYIYHQGEIMIFNAHYAYHYRYALESKRWYRVTNEFTYLHVGYPAPWVMDASGNLHDLSVERSVSKEVALVTRWIKINPLMHGLLNKLVWLAKSEQCDIELMVTGGNSLSQERKMKRMQFKGRLVHTAPISLRTPYHKFYRTGIKGRVSADTVLQLITIE